MAESKNLVNELEKLITFVDSFKPVETAQQSTSSSAVKAASESSDKAFDPDVPLGHTAFSWKGKEQRISPAAKKAPKKAVKSKPLSTKPAAVKAKPSKKKAPTKPKARPAKAAGVTHGRRDRLIEMQTEMQALWDSNKAFESNPEDGREKFMCTFPYPYMNGLLHLGHAFSLSKAEFAAGFQRLKGKNVLFPFGFHCTGMPIPAAAMKLKDEIKEFGNPPKFPVETKEKQQKGKGGKKKKKKGKGKAANKKSKSKYQWQIMQEFGLSDEEIAKFVDVNTWIDYFPPLGMEHLKKFGIKADFRRSFITTKVNPFYDAFIRWQFNTLQKKKKIVFGNRPCVWDPRTNQVCAAHDRSEGEDVKPQNYTLIKIKVLPEGTPYTESQGKDPLGEFFASGKPVYMVAGTLRPETMYGQTNCFVLPNGEYCVVETKDGELWVTGESAAKNMSWQKMLNSEQGEVNILAKFWGKNLLGRKVQAPLAKYDHVYVLPLLTILMDKATGIVTSVPSDAPDDYAALMDMKKNEKQRKQYYITKEMVDPFEVVEIIEIPSNDKYPQLGRKSAADMCVAYKVKSQKDTDKLAEIKDICYNEGFKHGKMIVGEYTGTPVKEAKQKVKDDMIAKGLAANYYEPEDIVTSRTGERCVVVHSDQWLLQYGEKDDKDWFELVQKHMAGMEFHSEKRRAQFDGALAWLHEWACSRTTGAGTTLPIDDRFVVESLSDSTIYMAYYTICHTLQGNCSFKGEGSDIDPTWLTDEVFDYIYLGKTMPSSPIGKDKLEQMRNEFLYWYPMDLRVSGKDLIKNHLTMALYNHSAIWEEEPDKWPLSYYTNGHVMIDGEKMAKSTGNFVTLSGGCDEFSSDAVRFGLADAGDGCMDANFDRKVTNSAILNLTKEENWITEQMEQIDLLRTGDLTEMDRMFANAMSHCVSECHEAYEKMHYKQALKYGWHKLRSYRDFWRSNSVGLHKDLVMRFIEVQLVILAPICPHFCEYMWQKLQKMGFPAAKGFVINASWPKAQEFDYTLNLQFDFIQEMRHLFQKDFANSDRNRKKMDAKKKTNTPEFNACRVFVANKYLDYQIFVLETFTSMYDEDSNSVDPAKYRDIFLKGKHDTKKTMDFATMIVKDHIPERGVKALSTDTPFDEMSTIRSNLALIIGEVQGVPAENVFIYDVDDPKKDDPKNMSSRAIPLSPKIQFYTR